MADTPAAPPLLEPLLAHIPLSLQTYPNWVLWRLIERDGKATKIPFQLSGTPARSNDPATWTTFASVCAAYKRGKGHWSGIGIMLEGSDLVGIDLDDKDGTGTLLDSNGNPTESLAAVLAHLDTYAEVSPGGKGVRILARGTIPRSGRRGPIEVYASGSPRFLTITGRKLPGARETIEERTEALGEFYREVFTLPPSRSSPTPSPTPLGERVNKPAGFSCSPASPPNLSTLSPREAGEGVGEVRTGGRASFDALLRGDLSLHNGDHSAADLALAGLLLRQTKGDLGEADRLFRASGLMRAKWDTRHSTDGRTYGQMTLDKAQQSYQRCSPAPPGPARPVLVLNGRQQWEIARDAWGHLKALNRPAPTLFYREAGGTVALCRLMPTSEGTVMVQALTPDTLAPLLRRACDLVCWTKAEKTLKQSPAQLPRWLPLDMVHSADARAFLPRLRAVVGCPVITPEGRLLATPGYHPASGLYLDAPAIALPESADPAAAKTALTRLFAPFAEFPYQSAGDRANAMALLLTPFLRHFIRGPVPLCFVEAPTPGTGKSLLARCLLLVSTPGVVVSGGPSERERGAAEEWSKQLPALLSSAPAALLLDNLRGTITSGTLEMLLTSEGVVQVRKLGKSDEVQSIDVSGLTIAATGNNASLPRDMARRCYFVRIDAGVESPETRTGFQIPDLGAHLHTHRAALLTDVLTILTAWIQAGRPVGATHKGSFAHWAGVLSGVLELCGISGFLASDTERAEEADSETLQWRAFFHAWHQQAGDSPRTAKELVDLAIEHEIVMDSFGASRVLGRKLQAARDRVFGEHRIVAHRGAGGVFRFSLTPCENSGSSGLSGSFSCHIRNEKEDNNSKEGVDKPTKPTIPTGYIPAPPVASVPHEAGDSRSLKPEETEWEEIPL